MGDNTTLDEIRKEGIEALAKALGRVGMVRFLQSFDTGRGDYTKERHKWPNESVEDIVREMGKGDEWNLVQSSHLLELTEPFVKVVCLFLFWTKDSLLSLCYY